MFSKNYKRLKGKSGTGEWGGALNDLIRIMITRDQRDFTNKFISILKIEI